MFENDKPTVPQLAPGAESMPLSPAVTNEAIADIAEPDPLMAGAGKMPELLELPSDWVPVFLHPVEVFLKMRTRLPRLWEQELGAKQERLLATSRTPLFPEEYKKHMGEDWLHIVDVMPKTNAEAFEKWVGRQVFTKKSEGLYLECVPHWIGLPIAPGLEKICLVVVPATTKIAVLPAPGELPLQFWQMQPGQDIQQRALSASDSPTNMLVAPKMPEPPPLQRK